MLSLVGRASTRGGTVVFPPDWTIPSRSRVQGITRLHRGSQVVSHLELVPCWQCGAFIPTLYPPTLPNDTQRENIKTTR